MTCPSISNFTVGLWSELPVECDGTGSRDSKTRIVTSIQEARKETDEGPISVNRETEAGVECVVAKNGQYYTSYDCTDSEVKSGVTPSDGEIDAGVYSKEFRSNPRDLAATVLDKGLQDNSSSCSCKPVNFKYDGDNFVKVEEQE